jgi:hypothetical protein
MTEKQLKAQFEKYTHAHEPKAHQSERVWERVQSGSSKQPLFFSTFMMKFKYILPVLLLVIVLSPAGFYLVGRNNVLPSPIQESLVGYRDQGETAGKPSGTAGSGTNDGMVSPDYYYNIGKDKNYDPNSAFQDKRAGFVYLTNDVSGVKTSIEKLVGEFKGVVTASRFYSTTYAQAAYTIQIPVENFSSFVAALRSVDAKIAQEDISLSDRQEEFDLLTSERTKLVNRRDSLRAQLASATTDVQRAEIRAQLKTVEAELKSIDGKQTNIKQATSFSEINITINEDSTSFSWGKWAQKWFRTEEILNSLGFMIAFWANVLIWASVPLLTIWLAVRAWRNRAKKKEQVAK